MKVKTISQKTPKQLAQCDCGCSFFEQLETIQIDRYHTVGLGNKIPVVGDKFYFLRCIVCGSLYEPNLLSLSVGEQAVRYGKLLDRIENETN